jgi:predicted enzyme related to lactoylglutathione lyase
LTLLGDVFNSFYSAFEFEGWTMTDRGLIGAVLYAKDLGRLVDFYASVAGIAPQTIEKGYAILASGRSQFVIVRIPKRIADTIDIAAPPEVREDTPVKLVFGVEDIAHARDRAAELGGAVDAADDQWEFAGAAVCDGHDPEGNVFQLRQTG